MYQLFIIFILFFTSSFAEFHQMKYEIDFQLQCSHLPQGTIKNYTMNNRVYQCSIPNRKNKVKQNNEEQWENIVTKLPDCVHFNNGYFNYSICFGQNVTQSRIVNGKKVTETLLSKRMEERKFLKNTVKERYVDGHICLENGQRNVVIQYQCPYNNIENTIMIGMQ